jgi:hypothetical protein
VLERALVCFITADILAVHSILIVDQISIIDRTSPLFAATAWYLTTKSP